MIELSDKYKTQEGPIVAEQPRIKSPANRGSKVTESEDGGSQEKSPFRTMMLTLLIAS